MDTSSSKSDGSFSQCGREGWGKCSTKVEGRRSSDSVVEGRSSTAVVEGMSSATVMEGRSTAAVVEGMSSLPWWGGALYHGGDGAHCQDGGGELHQGGRRAWW